MIAALRSEWLLLNRARIWVALGITTIAFGVGSILLLAAFTSTAANEFTRGTFRAAVVKHPDRGTLVGGKVLARTGVAALMMAAAVVAGSVTAALVAPSQDI